MFRRSGLTASLYEKGGSDKSFEEVLQGMKIVHQGKEVLYGHYVETHGSDPKMFALMEHFADIKRKFVRAEHFMKKSLDGEDFDILELFDTYSDIAVYGAMGVQLIAHLIERDGNERTRSDDPTPGGKQTGERSSDPANAD